MFFIGDVHGKFDSLKENLDKLIPFQSKDEPIIQLGDFGVGFPKTPYPNSLELPQNFHFIRGNHDNPEHCYQHKSYLGDWGYKDQWKTFYLSGAESVDKDWRTLGIDYWDDEELSWETLLLALDSYKEIKPRIVVAHDCPFSVANEFILQNSASTKRYPYSRTEQALETFIESWEPEYFFFGHWHPKGCWTHKKGKTTFVCLGELQIYKL